MLKAPPKITTISSGLSVTTSESKWVKDKRKCLMELIMEEFSGTNKKKKLKKCYSWNFL